MSIRKMIAAHPDVAGHINEPLTLAVRHAMYAAVIATSCADACAAEQGDMRQCIRLCLDCADICTATMHVAARRTGDNRGVLRSMLQLCVEACEACAAECARHDHDHCRRCAAMAQECADDCRQALATLG